MEECIDFTIRPFHQKDQAACKELILSGLAGYFSTLDLNLNQDLDDIETSYLASGSAFVVAESDTRIIGTGALIFEKEFDARIVRLSVLSNTRRGGVGEAIVRNLITRAREAGFSAINVETNHDWYPARKLYEKSGFFICGFDDRSVHYKINL
jgi:ribosomal protein S18 acetylase RimI-like enzyme